MIRVNLELSNESHRAPFFLHRLNMAEPATWGEQKRLRAHQRLALCAERNFQLVEEITYSIDSVGFGQAKVWIPGGCVTTSGGDGGSPDTTTCVPPDQVSLVDLFGLSSSGGSANNGTPWWSKWIPKVPINLTVIVPVLGIVGPTVTITYLPQTNNLCVSPGLGASVGRNVSAGPLVLGNLANAKSITEGASISVGAQATPLLGAQATGNFSGILGGPTVGMPGGSVTATYGVCF
jgi:hypothetical protein